MANEAPKLYVIVMSGLGWRHVSNPAEQVKCIKIAESFRKRLKREYGENHMVTVEIVPHVQKST